MGSLTHTQQHGRVGAAMADDAFFAEHGWTRVPRLVQWMVTSRCPMSCAHCLAAGDGGGPELSLRQAAELIAQVAEMGVEELLLTGGEPLARGDLPALIHILRAHRVRWSLNTATMPGRLARRAMEEWPPCFAAVSLDGPREVHDVFRGRLGAFDAALESIAFFAHLATDGTAAGTTVTTQNVDRLAETFAIVLGSGATSWGLHLVVPEGRAAQRHDLFLSRSQLKALLRFAASKRGHFPVAMADEIGYCGPWEPLVRDQPFFCGAGKAQCVVLPDGEVVPCTTMDRSTSAGSVLRTPLRAIWEQGFAELRAWTPRGACASCRYAAACEGGCWLQRRHGTQCFQRVWQAPRALTRAGMAVCLGLAAAGLPAPEPAQARGLRPPLARPEEQRMELLQSSIIQWYAAQLGGFRAPSIEQVRKSVGEQLPDDPGARYFLAFAAGKRPEGIAARAEAIETALTTRQRSLCLVGLAWRDLAEWCFDAKPPAARSAAERQALRRALTGLATTAEAWRKEVYRGKLDPFLRRPLDYRRFLISKAGPPADMRLASNLAAKRGWSRNDITEAFLEEHPHAEVMTLAVAASDPRVRCLRAGAEQALDGGLRVFDVLVVPARQGQEAIALTIATAVGDVRVDLPPDAELTYADVLRLALGANRAQVEKLARPGYSYRRAARGRAVVLPLFHEQLKALAQAGTDPATDSRRRALMWQLVDIYLF